jgi:hypothetical protein
LRWAPPHARKTGGVQGLAGVPGEHEEVKAMTEEVRLTSYSHGGG